MPSQIKEIQIAQVAESDLNELLAHGQVLTNEIAQLRQEFQPYQVAFDEKDQLGLGVTRGIEMLQVCFFWFFCFPNFCSIFVVVFRGTC